MTDWFIADHSWLGRELFQRALAAVYLVAFVSAAGQYRGLLGERGLMPMSRYLAAGDLPPVAQHLPAGTIPTGSSSPWRGRPRRSRPPRSPG